MRGCGKVLVDGCWMLGTGCETIFFSPTLKGGKLERKIFAPTLKGEIFLNCKGRKIVYCYLSFEITTEGAL